MTINQAIAYLVYNTNSLFYIENFQQPYHLDYLIHHKLLMFESPVKFSFW